MTFCLQQAAVSNPAGLKAEVTVDCTDKRATLSVEEAVERVQQGVMLSEGKYPDTPDGAPRYSLVLQQACNVSVTMELNESSDGLGVQLHLCRGLGGLGLKGLLSSSRYLGGSKVALSQKLAAGEYAVVPAAVGNSAGAAVKLTLECTDPSVSFAEQQVSRQSVNGVQARVFKSPSASGGLRFVLAVHRECAVHASAVATGGGTDVALQMHLCNGTVGAGADFGGAKLTSSKFLAGSAASLSAENVQAGVYTLCPVVVDGLGATPLAVTLECTDPSATISLLE